MRTPALIRTLVFTASLLCVTAFALTASAFTAAPQPDCAHPEGWPASVAFGFLRDDSQIDTGRIDGNKTKVTRLASEQTGEDAFVQIHLVQFFGQDSEPVVRVITVNEAASDECSLSSVDVYVVTEKMGLYTKGYP